MDEANSTETLDGLAHALDRTASLVAAVSADALDAPTPCEAWTLGELLEHMTGSLRGYAASASGEGGPPPAAEDGGARPEDYRRAVDDLVAAWRAGGVEGRTIHARMGDIPAAWAVLQQTADTITHGWDVAKATGQPSELDPDVGQFALDWGRENLKPEFRGDEAGGKTFGPEVAVPDEAMLYDRVAGFFGRDPSA